MQVELLVMSLNTRTPGAPATPARATVIPGDSAGGFMPCIVAAAGAMAAAIAAAGAGRASSRSTSPEVTRNAAGSMASIRRSTQSSRPSSRRSAAGSIMNPLLASFFTMSISGIGYIGNALKGNKSLGGATLQKAGPFRISGQYIVVIFIL
ncbi:MAG: hypothetical protein A4E28_01031 [Methanocella sp. PtaU1.Bin125]|nr:MAG: hypothetical protein A4E28_01031 [Methanocella sp. PtaU1.Bin125]